MLALFALRGRPRVPSGTYFSDRLFAHETRMDLFSYHKFYAAKNHPDLLIVEEEVIVEVKDGADAEKGAQSAPATF
jgi:hypothetical protein